MLDSLVTFVQLLSQSAPCSTKSLHPCGLQYASARRRFKISLTTSWSCSKSETDPTPRNGRWVFMAVSTFDVVTILRVRRRLWPSTTIARLQAVLELPLMQDVRILDCFAVKPSMIMLVSLSDGFSVVNSSPGGVYRDVLTLLAVELA
ncbi:hypothetical protein DYB34_007948 [Aphanomyces astaci]|uniref:Uncharacterized protein n=3 Tax=Aphanomyces astaci TaxID=112090 RepID=A0A3R7AB55_APHAT|nr:hypothetical protein DYB34_007948 [Aphanomyces astaci]